MLFAARLRKRTHSPPEPLRNMFEIVVPTMSALVSAAPT